MKRPRMTQHEEYDPEIVKILLERQHGPLIPWKDVEAEFLPKRKRPSGKRRHTAKSL